MAVKKSDLCDSVLNSQEESINLLLSENDNLRNSIEYKSKAFTGCMKSLKLESDRVELYSNINDGNKKRIRQLKVQRYILIGFGFGVGFLVAN